MHLPAAMAALMLALLAPMAGGAGTGMPSSPGGTLTLEHPGQAIAILGPRSRIDAFFGAEGDRLRLTVVIARTQGGGDILRGHVLLRDGQGYTLRLGGGDAPGGSESFHFLRRGGRVDAQLLIEVPPGTGDAAVSALSGMTDAALGPEAAIPAHASGDGAAGPLPGANPFYLNQPALPPVRPQQARLPLPPAGEGSAQAPALSPAAPGKPVALSRHGFTSRAGPGHIARIASLD